MADMIATDVSGVEAIKLIRKGQKVGTVKKAHVKSDSTFYPLFLGRGRYKKTLALISNKSRLNIV